MMYGRDESAPTATVCSLILCAMNKPCGVFDEYYYSFIGLNVLFCFNWVNNCRLCNTFIS